MSLKIGDTISNFTLQDQNGDDFDSATLVGKKSIVIFFYPKDYTPGCTKEACSFRDNYEEFTNLGAEVIGISSDSVKMHQKFAKSYKLPFTLLADPKKKVRKLFKIPNKFFGLLPGRETYVVDKNGKIMMIFNSSGATKHIEKALAALKDS